MTKIQTPKSAPSILELIERLKTEKHTEIFFNTSFQELDYFMNGLRGLVVLAGAPKTGKSTMAHQIAIYQSLKGTSVFYVDFEHSWKLLTLKLISCLTGKTIEDIKEDINTEKFSPYLSCLRIWSGHILPSDIRYNLVTFNGENQPTLIIIDSLQKLPRVPGTDTRGTIDAWLRELEAIKNDFPCVLLVISELSRGEGGKNYTTPALSSLKESGDIEYTAEQVLVFSQGSTKEKFRLHLVANRHGISGEIPAEYSRENFWCWRWKEIPNESYRD